MARVNETEAKRRVHARAEREAAGAAEAARDTRRRRARILGGGVLTAIVVAVVLGLATSGGDDKPSRGASASGGAVAGTRQTAALLRGIPQSGVTLGDPKAPVKLVEFVDLQCPICRRYTAQVLPTLVRDYVRNGKASIDLRVISILGPDSTTAQTVAARATAQNRLWAFAETFYANQGQEGSGYVTAAFLGRLAAASGVKAGGASGDAVGEAESLARQYAVDSTPTLLVGRRGGTLRPLVLRTLEPGAVTPALDALAPKT